MKSRNHGFTLVEAVITVGLAGLALLVVSTFHQVNIKQLQRLEVISSLAKKSSFLRNMLKDRDLCSCQINRADGSWALLEAGGSVAPMNMQWLATGCDLSPGTVEYFAQEGENFFDNPSVKVTKVTLKNISEMNTPDNYVGVIEIALSSTLLGKLKPIRSLLTFEVDPISKKPQRCLEKNAPKGFTECPPGYYRTGASGQRGNFCIEITPSLPLAFKDAYPYCANQFFPGFNTPTPCEGWIITFNKIYHGAVINLPPGRKEFVVGAYGGAGGTMKSNIVDWDRVGTPRQKLGIRGDNISTAVYPIRCCI